jgi:hypothetical protein
MLTLDPEDAVRNGEHYASERRLCGIARHYGESLEIGDLTCMHKGAATCEILLRRAAG